MRKEEEGVWKTSLGHSSLKKWSSPAGGKCPSPPPPSAGLKLEEYLCSLKKNKGRAPKVTSPDDGNFSSLICQQPSILAHFTKQTVLITGLLVILFFTFFHKAETLKGCVSPPRFLPAPGPSLPPPAQVCMSGPMNHFPWAACTLGGGIFFLLFFFPGEDSHRLSGEDKWNWLPCSSKVSKDFRENVRRAFVTRGTGGRAACGRGEKGK